MEAKNLIQTSVDITKVYGKERIPEIEDITTYVVDYEKSYGFKDLSASTINSKMKELHANNTLELQYISDKLGFDHNDNKRFDKGLDVAESWGLINSDHTKDLYFYCQNTRARSQEQILDCISKHTNLDKSKLAAFFSIQKPSLSVVDENENENEEFKFL